ncbi:ATP-binding cassette domain-containing protein [Vibrio sp. SS-MA-C1-2]|uniref:ATP-binding cassette domain-containing protein n=1 Tax=Vibrio sp. SS-MA-C1-2 TaxID=2908646 RepID=UPI00288320A6|nr:ATP-binding cassette domain-containing protein [Vibrio sp. SS-MA-C1-2]
MNRHKQLNQLLKDLELDDAKDKLPNSLSGGMAQRVAIGRTLFLNRKFWVLDEPFSQLDAMTKRKLHRLIKTIVKEYQVTVVLVTHDINEAVQLSGRVIALNSTPIKEPPIVEIEREGLSYQDFEFSELKQQQVKQILDLISE